MKKLINVARMAMCVLGVTVTSSCSKEDFFGLNEYEYLDYSKKTEIALSQEYTDYSIACLKLSKAMDNLGDTTKMQNKGSLNGKSIVYEETNVSIIDLATKLKNAYPELAYADAPDFEDIHRIAISQNKVLKSMAPRKKNILKTRSVRYTTLYGDDITYEKESQAWVGIVNDYTRHQPNNCSVAKADNYTFTSHWDKDEAIGWAILTISSHYSNDPYYWACSGGLIFTDNSAISVIGNGETGEWPSFTSSGNVMLPYAEKDFCFVNTETMLNPYDMVDRLYGMGYTFLLSNRQHVFVSPNGEVIGEF